MRYTSWFEAFVGSTNLEVTKAMIELTTGDILKGDSDAIVGGAPQADKMQQNRNVPNMTAGRAALVELMGRYIRGLLDPTISLLEVHKLMYFMQAAGEPLRLKYVKAPYDPYAENLRHVLKAIEGHMVAGYADGGDDPTKPLSLVSGIASEAMAFLDSHPPTKVRLDRVGKLVDGFETPFGLELLATVHWVATNDGFATTRANVVQRVHAWSERKQKFTSRQIGIALDVLADQGWINTAPAAEYA